MADNNNQVFTPAQVAALWQYQFGPWRDAVDILTNKISDAPPLPLHMHPFTCPDRVDHPEIAGDKGILVPTVRGWICPFCDYTQNWAHDFMLGSR